MCRGTGSGTEKREREKEKPRDAVGFEHRSSQPVQIQVKWWETGWAFPAGQGIVNLTDKTTSYFTSREWVYLRVTELQSTHASFNKTIGKSSKQNRAMLFSEGGGNRGGLFWIKVHWRKTRGVQVDDSWSLAEVQGWTISCRRGNVHLSLLAPVVDDSFLLRFFC